jgi:CheY-like chemotaxis protein
MQDDAKSSVPRRVLIADDDPDTRHIWRLMLEHHGSTVDEAEDGEACLQLARDTQPSIIVIDLALPGMDGWELAEALKADALTASIPVVACSGHVMPLHRERALAAGCVAFLAKPIAPSTLVRELAAVVRDSQVS